MVSRLNTRQLVRGRGTDNEDPGHHPTNTFIMYGSAASRLGNQRRPKSAEALQMKVWLLVYFRGSDHALTALAQIDVQKETQTVISESVSIPVSLFDHRGLRDL